MPKHTYPLSSQEIKHYKDVGVNAANVSEEVLGMGAQMLARPYTPNGCKYVVKTPLTQLTLGCMTNAYSATIGRLLTMDFPQAAEELRLCHMEFTEFMIKTTLHPAEDKRRFSVVQEHLDMEPVTQETIKRGKVREDIQKIFTHNAVLMRTSGKWLDTMGFHPWKLLQFATFGTPYFENVVLRRDTDIVQLFDFGLFPVTGLYFRFLLWLQRKNAQKFGLNTSPIVAA